jgi:hypothetical protein
MVSRKPFWLPIGGHRLMNSEGVEAVGLPSPDEGVEPVAEGRERTEHFGLGSFFERLREHLSPEQSHEVQPLERVEGDRTGLAQHRPNAAFRELYEGEYIEPDTEPAHVGSFADPDEFTDRINPHFEDGTAYQVNCWECARAVESTWRGSPEVAAGRATLPGELEPHGEVDDRSEAWYGQQMRPTSAAEIRETLLLAGEGSSVIATVQYRYLERGIWVGGGHAFNYVNCEGRILLVDGQSDKIAEASDRWPPDDWDSSVQPISMTAMGWDREGEVLWNSN